MLGLIAYAVTSAPVFLAARLSGELADCQRPRGCLEALTRYDGMRYAEIARCGYSYRPGALSTVAFFPGYPLAARAVATVTGLSTCWSLVAVSNAALAGAFVVMSAYARARFECQAAAGSAGEGFVDRSEVRRRCERGTVYTLLTFGLLPTTFFCRMAYSESTFLLTALAALYAIEAEWPIFIRSALVGAATGTRAVGLVLVLPLLLSIMRTSPDARSLFSRLAYSAPLALWGIAGFMVYQHASFGDALAFAKAQSECRVLAPTSPGEKVASLLAAAPLWGVFDPTSPGFWRRFGATSPLLSLQFANPIFFVLTSALVIFGARRGWLSAYETLTSAGLLAMPYCCRGFEGCMVGQARFAVAVFPAYLIMGRLVARLPAMAAAALALAGAALLGLYTLLFSLNRPFY